MNHLSTLVAFLLCGFCCICALVAVFDQTGDIITDALFLMIAASMATACAVIVLHGKRLAKIKEQS